MKRAVKRGVALAALIGVFGAGITLTLLSFRNPLQPGSTPPRPNQEAPPVSTARVALGERWQLRVKTYNTFALGFGDVVHDPNKTEVPLLHDDFAMSVEAVPPRHAGDGVIARRLFTPGARAPEARQGRRCILELDEGTGEAEGVRWPDWDGSGAEPRVEIHVMGKEKCLLVDVIDAGNHFPLDWIINASDLAAAPQSKRELVEEFPNHRGRIVKTIEPTTATADIQGADGRSPDAVRVTYSMVLDGNVGLRVVQVWVPGEPWWRSFQRWQGSYLMVEAFRVEGK